MKTPLTFLLSLTFLFLFSGSVYGGDLQDADDAYKRKDYKEAHILILPLAEQGLAEAQFKLGLMYFQGTGVPQDYKEAVRLFRLSAEQEYERAQYNLGLMYEKGKGVPQDYVSAHLWWNICGSSGDKYCVHNRDIIEKRMSPTQIEKAQDMARNWKPKK
jgi:uncharacterized protein